jgi:hypothetical protein
VATQKARHRGAQSEAEKPQPAIGEHHHEGPQIPLRPSHRQLAEVRPVHLRLLPREHRAAQVGFRVGTRTQPTDDRAKRALRPRVAALLHHRPEPARAQARMLRQRLLDEGQIRVHQPGTRRRLGDWQPALRQHAFHRVVVPAELRGDRAHRPLLSVMEAEDRRALFRAYHPMTFHHDDTSRPSRQPGNTRTTTTAFGASLTRSRTAGEHAPAARAAHDRDAAPFPRARGATRPHRGARAAEHLDLLAPATTPESPVQPLPGGLDSRGFQRHREPRRARSPMRSPEGSGLITRAFTFSDHRLLRRHRMRWR